MLLPCHCELIFSEARVPGQLVHAKSPPTLAAYEEFIGSRGAQPSPRRLLEIGVQYGGSLALWGAWFGPAVVVGVDRNPQIDDFTATHFTRHGIRTEIISEDATSPAVCEAAAREGPFDWIIDDGSHSYADITATLARLWPHVAPGGWYLIEDWTTDDGQPTVLFAQLAAKMIGYWPSPEAPAGAWDLVQVRRPFIALRKPKG